MPVRIHTPQHLEPGLSIGLEPTAARHVQVLRLQPNDVVALFNSASEIEGEFSATIERMGRSTVDVRVGEFRPTQTQMRRAVHLAVGMPANERMDWLVEKATELGVASIQPLTTERSVLRLAGERAEKKRAHWQAIAVAACEQCGRNRVPLIHAPSSLSAWLPTQSVSKPVRMLLSLQVGSLPLVKALGKGDAFTFLSGPEGGLNPGEEALALANGFVPVTLGARVLRSETSPLACLSLVMLTENP